MRKVRGLYLQLGPMRQLAEQLKKDKQQGLSKVATLETDMDAIIHRIQVGNRQGAILSSFCQQTINKELFFFLNILLSFNYRIV